MDEMDNFDKFIGNFKLYIEHNIWGHGESGYSLTVFSSHEKEEVEKAKSHLEEILKNKECA